VPFDLVAKTLSGVSKEIFKRCRKGEMATDYFERSALTGEIISEDTCNVSPCDAAQWWGVRFENLSSSFFERNVLTIRGKLQRYLRQLFLCQVLQRLFDTLPLRQACLVWHNQPRDP
jgi:hypothetical protein